MADPFGTFDLKIDPLFQLAVGDAGQLGDLGPRLHGIEAASDKIPGRLVFFFLLRAGTTENRHPGNIAEIAAVAGAEIRDHALPPLVAALVVSRRAIQHEETRGARIRSLLDHRYEQPPGDLTPAYSRTELRPAAIVALHRDLPGGPHRVDLKSAFEI